ncbi:MAG: serine/threonine-protein phosphatase 6 regulatory ankyrin repeat subunit C-like [Rickettsiaceae bacterium]|jgi:ankyrin repeat protein|nr:serine/threonine-protein phosphatase 6 regulatory ankyrin repeat subunit C-like [Rickettsiaceae bacterium]
MKRANEDLNETNQSALEIPEAKRQKTDLIITVESSDPIASELLSSIKDHDLDKFKAIVDSKPKILDARNIFTFKLEADSLKVSYEHLLALCRFSEGISYIVSNNINADWNCVATDGATPLTLAAQNGHTTIVEKLLAAGADVNKANEKNGATPLIYAAEKGHTAIVEELVAAGADINKANEKNGTTPLMFAAYNGHTAIALKLIAAGADVNKANEKDSFTPLTLAAYNGHTATVEKLLAAGADVNKANEKNGATPLMFAAGKAKTVIQQSNKVNSSNNSKLKPLPSDTQYTEVVKLLLKTNKVNLGTKDKVGGDAVIYAKEAGLSDVGRTIELYTNFCSVLEGKNNKLELLKLISPEHELAAKDFKFIKELIYQVSQDKWKFNNKVLNELIAKLYIDTNIAPVNNNNATLLQKHAFSYNIAINDAKKQFDTYIEAKKAELFRLEKLLVQAYYNDDLAELIDKASKNVITKEGKQEVEDSLSIEGILGLHVNHYKENGVTIYKATNEVFGKGEILRKFFNKIQNSTAPSSEILSPLMMNKDEFNQFELYFSLIKKHLPSNFKDKGESLIKIIKEEHAKPTFGLLAITVDNNNYLKEEVTELKSKLQQVKANNKLLQEQNIKLFGFMSSFTKLMSDNGIKGADELLKKFIGEGQPMMDDSDTLEVAAIDTLPMGVVNTEFAGNYSNTMDNSEIS